MSIKFFVWTAFCRSIAVAVMAVGLLAGAASAQEWDCGMAEDGPLATSAVKCAFDGATGAFTVSGAGAMAGYWHIFDRPWHDLSEVITSVTIGDGVTDIGRNAFNGCSNLTSITIGNGLASTANLPVVSIITVSADNARFSSVDGVLFNKSQDTLIAYPQKKTGSSYAIPNSVTSIGWGAFSGCFGLTSIEIPNSVTNIGGSAFSGCTSLTSIEIPNSVTSIGDWAFSGCTGLTSIEIPNSVTSIGSGAFRGCTGLTSINVTAENPRFSSVDGIIFSKDKDTLVIYPAGKEGAYTIPDGVTAIGNSAFSGSTGLTSIEIPNSVTSIGNGAFQDCCNLAPVTIPNSVTSLGDEAFGGWSCNRTWGVWTSGSTIITLDENDGTLRVSGKGAMAPQTLDYRINRSAVTKVIIEDGVTYIGNSAFSQFGSLTSVIIGDGVRSIGEGAFMGCTSLTSLTIGGGVTSIGRNAFSDCRGLTSLVIPDGVTSIGQYAFSGLTNLKSLIIGDGVRHIGHDTFYDCTGLTSLVIGNGVTEISSRAFVGYTALTSVTIGNSVTTIGEQAFSGCSGLTSITLPNSVETIGSMAFYGCSGLTSITIPNSVKTIGHIAFQGCTNVTSITIGSSVDSIGNSAFDGIRANPNFTSVTSLNPTPPVFGYSQGGYWVFGSGYGAEAHGCLYVPEESVEAYRNSEHWSQNFDCIEAISTTSITSPDRNIPQSKPNEDAAVIAPVHVTAFDLTVGPNPVRRADGIVNVFLSGKRVDSGTLTVYDASGNIVSKISIADNAVFGNNGRRVVGSWDLRDAKGRMVPDGAYLLRGSVRTVDGKRELVSLLLGVR